MAAAGGAAKCAEFFRIPIVGPLLLTFRNCVNMKIPYIKYRNPELVDQPYLWWIIYWILYWLIFSGGLGVLFWGTGRGSYLTNTELIVASVWLIAGTIGGTVFNKTDTWRRQSPSLFWIIYWVIVAISGIIVCRIIGYTMDVFNIIMLFWWVALGVVGGAFGQIISDSINETDGPTYLGIFRTVIGLFWYLLFALIYKILGIAALVGLALFIGKLILGDIGGALVFLGVCLGSFMGFKVMGKFSLPN